MELTLYHIWNASTFSLGELYVDNKYFCDTLEDRIRPVGEKIKGSTAIPEGTYKVILNQSPRFKRILPRLLDVPNFEGILIHPGNSSKDTDGCILVGKWDGKTDWISNSKVTFDKLFNLLEKEDNITITVKHMMPSQNNKK